MTRPPPAAARSADKPRIRPNTAPPKGRTDTVARTDTQDTAAGRDDARGADRGGGQADLHGLQQRGQRQGGGLGGHQAVSTKWNAVAETPAWLLKTPAAPSR